MNSSKWIVSVKGGAGSKSFEIAVVRENNKHGITSYGWFNDAKLLITHNGGPCRDALIGLVWDKQIALALQVADELNEKEQAE